MRAVTDMERQWLGEEEVDSPTLEVRVLRHGALVHRELCASEADAAAVADRWSELDGITVELEELKDG